MTSAICVTSSKWALRLAPRTGGRVLEPGHFQRARARTWYPGVQGSACCERYQGYKCRTTGSARDRYPQCPIYMLPTKLSPFLLILKVTKHPRPPVRTQIRVQMRRQGQWLARHWLLAESMQRIHFPHTFGP